MKILIPLVVCFFQLLNVYNQTVSDEDLYRYPLKSISLFCQFQPDSDLLIDKTVLTYDNEKRLIKSSSSTSETVYSYNKSGLLVSKKRTWIHSKAQEDTLTVYTYNSNNNLVYSETDNNPKKSISYTYNKNGLLASQKDSLSNTLYTYEYDNMYRLIKKYKNDTLAYIYRYIGLNIFEEIHYEKDKTVIKSYDYDATYLLVDIKVDGNIIEKNIYLNEKLDKKKLFGNKSANNDCLNQFIRYEYFQ
jgi:YD repeat-containing protein